MWSGVSWLLFLALSNIREESLTTEKPQDLHHGQQRGPPASRNFDMQHDEVQCSYSNPEHSNLLPDLTILQQLQ